MYKDREEQKKYQREWYQRKKRGEETKTKHIVTLSTIEKNVRKRAIMKRLRREKREFLLDKFGHNCIVCGKEQVALHNIYGDEHKDFTDMSWENVRVLVDSQKDVYKPLCKYCHRSIHWAMKYLHLQWNDIEKLGNL